MDFPYLVIQIIALLLYLAVIIGLGVFIARWGAIEAIKHVLKEEPELVGRVMLRLLKTKRFREELKRAIAEAVQAPPPDRQG